MVAKISTRFAATMAASRQRSSVTPPYAFPRAAVLDRSIKNIAVSSLKPLRRG
jgi:hypothetical protein